MEEIWKDIDGFNGVYQVSTLGRVKSVERIRKGKANGTVLVKEKILKFKRDKDGYMECSLCTGKHRTMKYYRVHRLVAQAFISNPNNYPIINHKNEIKDDNRVENLEWCTQQYNTEYSWAKPILQFSKTGEFIKKWKSCAEIERELGLYHSSIQKCCIGKNKSSGGFKWGYADDYERIPFKVFDIEIYRKRVA